MVRDIAERALINSGKSDHGSFSSSGHHYVCPSTELIKMPMVTEQTVNYKSN